jgi:hypothetical protein
MSMIIGFSIFFDQSDIETNRNMRMRYYVSILTFLTV